MVIYKTQHGRRRRGGRGGSSRPTFCAIHFNTIILWYMHVRACAQLVCKPHTKQPVLIQQVRRSIGMSASHSPAIGGKPIELLDHDRGTVRFWAWFNYFWVWPKNFARALCAH